MAYPSKSVSLLFGPDDGGGTRMLTLASESQGNRKGIKDHLMLGGKPEMIQCRGAREARCRGVKSN